MMKKVFLMPIAAVMAAVFALAGCSDKHENENIMNFYLSQPRDPKLLGWWEDKVTYDDETVYHWFREDGTVLFNLSCVNGKIDMRGVRQGVYWYAKDNVYHTFDRNDGFKGWSPQTETKYEMRGDELWIDNKPDWRLFGKRTEPQPMNQ